MFDAVRTKIAGRFPAPCPSPGRSLPRGPALAVSSAGVNPGAGDAQIILQGLRDFARRHRIRSLRNVWRALVTGRGPRKCGPAFSHSGRGSPWARPDVRDANPAPPTHPRLARRCLTSVWSLSLVRYRHNRTIRCRRAFGATARVIEVASSSKFVLGADVRGVVPKRASSAI